MSVFEYIFNIISIIAIIDFCICKYQIYKNADLLFLVGINNITKVKMILERIVVIIYIAYLSYQLFF